MGRTQLKQPVPTHFATSCNFQAHQLLARSERRHTAVQITSSNAAKIWFNVLP
jgi:hypothetical protein